MQALHAYVRVGILQLHAKACDMQSWNRSHLHRMLVTFQPIHDINEWSIDQVNTHVVRTSDAAPYQCNVELSVTHSPDCLSLTVESQILSNSLDDSIIHHVSQSVSQSVYIR